MTPHENISLKLAELETTIKDNTPRMSSLLREIHQNLSQDPEIVTLLKPEQVAIVVAGLSKQTNTIILTSVIKKPKSSSKKDSSLSLDDI